MNKRHYDVIFLGIGVSGAFTAKTMARHTNVARMAMIDRRPGPGQVNTGRARNSGTGHNGRLESNLAIGRAIEVSGEFDLLRGFAYKYAPGAITTVPGLLFGVGAKDVAFLRDRFAKLAPHFQDLRLLERDEIARLEPALIEGRDPSEPVVALYTAEAYAVDFESVTVALHNEAHRAAFETGKTLDTYFDTEITRVTRTATGFELVAGDITFTCRSLEVAMGNNSILVAHELGFAQHLVPTTVGGSYYVADARVKGKVYTPQDEAVPFAALHFDLDANNHSVMRIGPLAILLFMMERGSYRTTWEYLKSGALTPRGILGWLRAILFNPPLRNFGLMCLLCLLPIVGKREFLRQVRRFIPLMQLSDLTFADGAGGVRGQLIDTTNGTMSKATRIPTPEGMPANFIAAPSPGASVSGGNAVRSVRNHVKWLGPDYWFDEEAMRADLLGAIPARAVS